ncbi:MAG: hypothetical protein IJ439_05725 [Tyzzerella sp.]|nr:hypothetical protein [Tyzzerella sp.]
MNDFSNLNHLPSEVKILIVNGQTLVDDAKEKMKDIDYGFDLTSKMQLKSDCKEVEKFIKLISKGKLSDKNKASLELSITRLHTTLDGLIKFFTR